MSNNITINVQGIEGMTLRDYFAAKAMQGMIANGEWLNNIIDATGKEADVVVSLAAYEVADAMLVAREEEVVK